MTEDEALAKMVAPGTRRPGKYREGVIQIHVTRACDKACFGCTQGSNLAGKVEFITLENFELAVKSLVGYFGVVGVFGGNPALHPQFPDLCEILRKHIPFEQRGLWCNYPNGHGKVMRETFEPRVSNINVHLDGEAYAEFKKDWPECMPVGLDKDSRHSPPFVAIKDVMPAESKRWMAIADCDINKHWSAMIAQFRGQCRAWFCEIAGAQSILHQYDPEYPDTGVPIPNELAVPWWSLSMEYFRHQVRQHCHDCGVPLRGYGELACATNGTEQVSKTHEAVYRPKKLYRKVEVVERLEQLGVGRLSRMTDYIGNARR